MPERFILWFFCIWNFLSGKESDAMKKRLIFYNATLGIFWEAAYVMVIIGIGLLFALTIKYF